MLASVGCIKFYGDKVLARLQKLRYVKKNIRCDRLRVCPLLHRSPRCARDKRLPEM